MDDRTRRAAGFVLARRSEAGWEFLLLRNARHGSWGFPKGHCEPGEDALTCARRELEEETGITEVAVVPGFREVSRYRVREGDRSWSKEVIYLLGTTRDDHRLSPEHDEGRWTPGEAARRTLPFEDSRRILVAAERILEERDDDGR